MLDNAIAVIDFGSQYTQLIVRRIRELGYFSRLYQPEQLRETGRPAAVILSGGPRSTTEENAPDIDFEYLKGMNVPVLGICYGMQLLNLKWGGAISPHTTREYGPANLRVLNAEGLLAGIGESQIWMSHSDTCKMPEGATVLATNQEGIQFHPEVAHTHEGAEILRNFLELAENPPRFEMESFKDQLVAQVKDEIGDHMVVCGVSGGVDSSVLAVLLHEAGVNVRYLFVDNGLLRKNEVEEVEAQFKGVGVEIETIDASERFLSALEGVEDPERKREIIGNLFIDVFFGAAGQIDRLAQGTLYPDVIESASSGSIASKIKTHHNRVDRILELKAQNKVVEPLHELFKDEVRELGRSLGLSSEVVGRHPFPGPGLAVRCPGAITAQRLEVIREADAIFIQMLKKHGLYDQVWQAYAAALPCKTVGVKGDERAYEWPIVLRAVSSIDAMTAEWIRFEPDFLAELSNRILNEVPHVNRVLYDISTKPPASIEWE